MNSIVRLDEFDEKVDRVGLGNLFCLSGAFDLVHGGHVSYVLDCKKKIDEICPHQNTLLVIIDAKKHVVNKNGSEFASQEERAFVISALKGVDLVVMNDENESNVIRALEIIKPNYFLKGGDRKDRESIPEWDVCVSNNIEIIVGIGDEKVTGSANILARVGAWFRQFERHIYKKKDPSDFENLCVLLLAVKAIMKFRVNNHYGIGNENYNNEEKDRDLKSIELLISQVAVNDLNKLIPAFFQCKEDRDLVHKILSYMGVIVPRWDYYELFFETDHCLLNK